MAVNCWLSPMKRLGLEGLTFKEVRDGAAFEAGARGELPPHPKISNAIPRPAINDTKFSSKPVREPLTWRALSIACCGFPTQLRILRRNLLTRRIVFVQ